MSHPSSREVTTVATGPYSPRTVGRSEVAWGLGDAGYDFSEATDVSVVEYPDPANMAAAERPLGFDVALGATPMTHTVEVVFTEQGQ